MIKTSNNLLAPRFLSGRPSLTPYVKICGVTNQEDALAAVEFGADALGFNLFPGSKRFLNLELAQSWIRELPAHIARVAVAVNPSLAEARDWMAGDLFHALQLHGQDWHSLSDQIIGIGKPLIAAIHVKRQNEQIFSLEWFGGFGFLFDAHREGDFGGTGETFPWELLQRSGTVKPVILAGGLTPENVQAAVEIAAPYGVDVATGVESKPGKKDHIKLRAFIAAVRNTAGRGAAL